MTIDSHTQSQYLFLVQCVFFILNVVHFRLELSIFDPLFDKQANRLVEKGSDGFFNLVFLAVFLDKVLQLLYLLVAFLQALLRLK